MSFQIETAHRTQAKLRIGLAAPSGGGKTMGALKLAYGITGDWSKIGLIDTEQGSGSLYSHLGPYKVIRFDAPFSPHRYIEAIHAFEEAGMEVIIIDSVTHVWNGRGGLLEYNTSLGGRFQDWAKTTPLYQSFLQGILESKAHVITTIRKKESYAISNEGGKTKVEKQGLDDEIRGGFNYELTVAFDLNIHHLAEASKDRTGLFMKSDGSNAGFYITEETGKKLKEWANEGTTAPVSKPVPVEVKPVEAKKDFIQEMEEEKQKAVVDEDFPDNNPPADTATQALDEVVCPIHGVEWKEFSKGDRTWKSHKTADGAWCNKKASPTAQKLMEETGKRLFNK